MNPSADTAEAQEAVTPEAHERGGKRPKRKKKESKYTADKYELYQHAVQSPETDVDFFLRVYREINDKDAKDFCGTAILCSAWVKSAKDRTAEGYDLDPEPVEWGKEKTLGLRQDLLKRAELKLS